MQGRNKGVRKLSFKETVKKARSLVARRVLPFWKVPKNPSHVWEIRLISVKMTPDQPKSLLLISVLLISHPLDSVNSCA